MAEPSEIWFDGDYSDSYLGIGHINRTDFAAVATEMDREMDPDGPPIDAQSVKHKWGYWTDHAPHEVFRECSPFQVGAFPFTQVYP